MARNDRSADGFPWIYCILTFGISWTLWIPCALSGQDSKSTIWIIPSLLGGFGPSVVGIVMTYRNSDKQARRDFWRRTFGFRRIGVGGYLFFALLVFPVASAASILVESYIAGKAPALPALSNIAANPALLVQMLVIGVFLGAFSEELGWRGYAVDRLQARWKPLTSALLLGVVWWAWHMPLFFIIGTTQQGWGFGSAYFFLFFVWVVSLSVLMTWLYNTNGRSILVAILAHFVSNFTLGLILPISTTGFLLLAIFLAVAAIAIVASGGTKRSLIADQVTRS
jgi:uncharacterized protein